MSATYHSTSDLCDRFRCSSRTLFRRMKRSRNPFPPPCMRHAGSCNLWDAIEVAQWEARERDHARPSIAPSNCPCDYDTSAVSRSAQAE